MLSSANNASAFRAVHSIGAPGGCWLDPTRKIRIGKDPQNPETGAPHHLVPLDRSRNRQEFNDVYAALSALCFGRHVEVSIGWVKSAHSFRVISSLAL